MTDSSTAETLSRASHKQMRVVGANPSLALWLRDLWLYRGVLIALCLRDIRGKYKQALLGVTWAVVQPTVQVGLFTLVFRGVANVKTDVAYPIFVLASLIPFNMFQQILTLGTPSFVAAQGIVTKVYFPRIYTVAAGSASSLVNMLVSVVLLVGACAYYRVAPSGRLLLAVPVLVSVAMLGLGLAAGLGALNARFRDVQHGLPLLAMVLMYVSPVLYPLESVPRMLRYFASLNPITGLVELFRFSLFGTEPSSWALVAGSVGGSLLVFAVGVWIFETAQARLIDVL